MKGFKVKSVEFDRGQPSVVTYVKETPEEAGARKSAEKYHLIAQAVISIMFSGFLVLVCRVDSLEENLLVFVIFSLGFFFIQHYIFSYDDNDQLERMIKK